MSEQSEAISNGWCCWLTGLPGSGKSTLAQKAVYSLRMQDKIVHLLDSDAERVILTPHPTYIESERDMFYRALAWCAWRLTLAGANVLIAATAHKAAYRQLARSLIERFHEIQVACAPETCAERDPKGLYAANPATLPGRGVNYEPPDFPDLVLDTDSASADDLAAKLVDFCNSL
jgi:adenylylsulfate kinase